MTKTALLTGVTPTARNPVVITGGAGFIGTNLAHRLLSAGVPVLIYDNLSRAGVDQNLQWLIDTHGGLVQVEVADTRNAHSVRRAVGRASHVFHFAAQVAVTTSLLNPTHDFDVNARGTLNVLEAIRQRSTPPPLIFTSTNKVYGGLTDIPLINGSRYEPADAALRASGISEARPLDFHSPYGCSKGTADQYILDYARTFHLPAVVFRMSCIYGPHQCGTEDQGWVAHFLVQTIEGRPIVIYGDGEQVRDVLFVDDLVDAFLGAARNIAHVQGHAFNIGGGPRNTTSLLELLTLIERLHGRRPAVSFEEWRPGDQRYYVSNISKYRDATGWAPQVSFVDGAASLYRWLLGRRHHARVEARRAAS
jgi:CDP-paratose 2-epimerase